MPSSDARKRGPAVPPALAGFVLLLLVLTSLSYAAGRWAGPVAPGMHRTDPGSRQHGGSGMDMRDIGAAGGAARVGR